ncbi:probable caffeoyl-CoA O-methyltransferase 1 isoform X1 [Dendrobium catenatum]|uniref:norbelladine O-methyltransferase n=1 Tax=Dendrobium catenatum TaxID=906689 RepID=A0A2I0WG85_9ASPA|nr:probable caffeoyl-CoA O-methyltransferase 1 isoform X1 [Dendrobium catenatum]XP_020672834.1 probable caffeoyl-CoA O-methyltransferase 1 isoform X1 [Dendrobium catenatum]PKU74658.1 Tricin synthase 1 [Dendrobium catenatum]
MAISPPSPFSLKPLPKLVSPGCQSEKLPQSFIFPRLTQLSLASRRTHAVEPAAAVPVVELEDEKYGKKQVISLSSGIYEYVLANVREPPVLRDLREETAGMRGSQMQVSPDQAQLLAILVQIMGAVKCIEIGVYTGYSSLAIALALPDSGSLVACERDANCLEIAKKYYVRAGVSHKVEIKHALAVDTLEKLIQNGESCSYDFAFVDAEKRMYDEYYELLLQLVRFGGVIIFDNVLWHGKVSDPQVKDSKTMSLRNFNKKILSDNRVSISMVPIGDGMTICRKRE